ncbi:MAG TPA: glycosyltransferase family A protein [Bryobacteraceae bacterium]|nr:glycosyltransferase family A protein [Bryobacteraceae bacterium]
MGRIVNPELTVFTATVFPDVARLWHGCIRRAFPADTRIEIFHDAAGEPLLPELYPGAAILARNPTRRDHHDAYNDAIRRAETPFVAIIDTDVFWVAPDLWSRVRPLLDAPDVAAVSCISRSRRRSHGTYAVIAKAEVYRKVLDRFPDGFYPAAEYIDERDPMEGSRWFDTGDRMTQAVFDSGHRVELLNFDKAGDLVRFYGVTLTRRGGDAIGERALAHTCGYNKYFWRGYVCNLVMQRLHDRVFDEGPRYYFPFGAWPLIENSLTGSPEALTWRLDFLRRMLDGANKIENFLLTPARS